MPVYRLKIRGRNDPILAQAETAAKARDMLVEAEAISAEEMMAELTGGAKLWNGVDALPADTPSAEDLAKQGTDKPKAGTKGDDNHD